MEMQKINLRQQFNYVLYHLFIHLLIIYLSHSLSSTAMILTLCILLPVVCYHRNG